MGAAIGEAVAQSSERVVLIDSESLSHCFWPMKELDQHEASDPKHVITPEARAADEVPDADLWGRWIGKIFTTLTIL